MWDVLWISTLAGVVGTGLGGLIGLLFGHKSNAVVSYLLAVAGGVMLSIVFFDLIPSALEVSGLIITALSVMLGVLAVWLLNKLIDKLTHSGSVHSNAEEMYHQNALLADNCRRDKHDMLKSGLVMFAVIALHNFPEGLAIGSGSAHSITMGLMLALLIALHNIPEGISIGVPLIEGGMNKYKAVLLTALAGAPTMLGGIAGALLGKAGDGLVGFSLALAGGAMLYVTFCEILPEVTLLDRSRTPALFSVAGVIFGMVMVAIL